ncbi:NAD(P)H-binding protein [Chitinispirillales bacterium ANBcel5]|uniref:NmrA family NAD(P)-binding protein n=1 Tax=Cellulosispirillum alkaliphilum TaxID=3039283 RepID=UPI002A5530E8|nr:NAD(P)H-binding protein [Chitinispirillales bacterium ANBcel5]
MGSEILITGATGVAGLEVIRRFGAMGIKVRAAIHRQKGALERLYPGIIEPVRFDFADQKLVDTALEGIKTVLLITPAVPEQAEYVRIFLERARLSGVSHIVRLSMFGTDKVPLIKYMLWHHEAEQIVKESGLDFTILRPNMFMQNFLTRMQPTGGLIYLPLGKGAVSYFDAKDFAAAAYDILLAPRAHKGNIYTFTGSQGLSMFQTTSLISEVIGTHVEYADISEETARHVLEGSAINGLLIDATIEHYAFQRVGLASEVTHDYERVTGNAAGLFVDFVRDNADLFRELVEHEEE